MKRKLIIYLLSGGGIGVFVGLFFFIIGLNLTFDEWYFAFIGFPFGFGETIGKYFSLEGWGMIFSYFFFGIISYLIIGMIISLLIYIIKNEKD